MKDYILGPSSLGGRRGGTWPTEVYTNDEPGLGFFTLFLTSPFLLSPFLLSPFFHLPFFYSLDVFRPWLK